MIFLSIDEVIALHSKLIKRTGGLDGVRDAGLLESAVNSAYAGYDDFEQYPSVQEKAARLAFSLISNHAFVDGNKRIGVLVMLMTLKLNGVSVFYTQAELVTLGLGAATGEYGYDNILAWIKSHEQTMHN